MSEGSDSKSVEWVCPAFYTVDYDYRLYKYRTFNDEALSILINAELFCASPENLNDPYDSQINVRKSLEGAFDFFETKNPKFAYAYEEARSMLDNPRTKKWIDSGLAVGICSLTVDSKNTLMWSHYGDQHKGFAIGIDPFKVTKQGRNWMIPMGFTQEHVVYTNGNPMIPAVQQIEDSAYGSSGGNDEHPNGPTSGMVIHDAIRAALSTKHISWSYESEIRWLRTDGQGTFPLEREAFDEIIFGSRMPERHRQTLRRLVESIGLPNVKFLEMVKSEDSLSFEVCPC